MAVPFGIREEKPIRFSLALPLGQLVLCAFLLWPIRGWIFEELGVPERLLDHLSLPQESSIAGRMRVWSSENGLHTVTLLNLPVAILQLPSAIFSPEHTDFHPSRVDLNIWRAVTWPILGTFFWWIAGRGGEAIAALGRKELTPRVTWAEAILGFVLLALSLTTTIGFVFFAGTDRHDPELQLAAVFGILWAFLGALPFIAKIMQRRLRKKLAMNPPTLMPVHSQGRGQPGL